MKIKWYGHSCFKFQSLNGVKVVTDPFNESVGYAVPELNADVVTISHEHYDHNNISLVGGEFELVNQAGIYEVKGITIEGIHTFHDDEMGNKRGKNIVFKFTIDNMTICHLGDLGHILDDRQLEKVKNIDVLLIPVGGTYTIDSKQASELAKRISPKIIIPMHYKTDKLKFNLATVDNFVREFDDVKYEEKKILEIEKDTIGGDNKVIIMQY
jgi:L-ascorbate metabolism protein UlaG (beta-lactamase superfamily)